MTGAPAPSAPAGPDGHAPRPHRPGPDQNWLELFYDLVFVAAIVVLSSAYSHDTSADQTTWLALAFLMIWTIWLLTTLVLNRVEVEGTWIRSLLVLQMILVLVVAVTADDTLGDHTYLVGPAFAGALVCLAFMYRYALGRRPDLRDQLRGRALRCVMAAALFLVTAAVMSWWYIPIWVAALVLVLVPSSRADPYLGLEPHAVVHRFGEFTIIMLGESFVKIGLVATEEPLDRVDLFGLPLTFVLVFAMWWLYFTDVPAAGLPPRAGRRTAWMLGHFPMHLGIVAVAVAMSKLLLPAPDTTESIQERFVIVPMAAVVLALAFLNWTVGTSLARRRARIQLVGGLAVLALLPVVVQVNTFDLEDAAVILTVILAVTGLCLRRVRPAPADDPDLVHDPGDHGIDRPG